LHKTFKAESCGSGMAVNLLIAIDGYVHDGTFYL